MRFNELIECVESNKVMLDISDFFIIVNLIPRPIISYYNGFGGFHR
ncbi:MAG: hypothetical protein KIG84_01290 [Bacteroidales bacterium]|nr:hypothetical protein [Bacteroidales bacterium]